MTGARNFRQEADVAQVLKNHNFIKCNKKRGVASLVIPSANLRDQRGPLRSALSFFLSSTLEDIPRIDPDRQRHS